MSRLAPNLRWIFARPLAPPDPSVARDTYHEAAAELRALLAVARAALAMTEEVNGFRYVLDSTAGDAALVRALARLRTASQSPRPRRQRAAPPRPPAASQPKPARTRRTR